MTVKYHIYQGNNPIAITEQKQYKITQLQPNTKYEFSVAAFNELREGSKTTISFQTNKPAANQIIAITEANQTIDWSKVAEAVQLVLIRVQIGISTTDTSYLANIDGAIKAGIPYAVVDEFGSASVNDAGSEASNFYANVQKAVVNDQQPVFYVCKVSTTNIPGGVAMLRYVFSRYINTFSTYNGIDSSRILIATTDKLYTELKSVAGRFGGTILASTAEPSNSYDLWQYTDEYVADGIDHDVARFKNPSETFQKFLKYPTADDETTNTFDLTIEHNLNAQPKVTVQYYEYAIGTEPKGLGTGPSGSFGGINYKNVAVTVDYPNVNSCIVHLPAQYQLTGQIKQIYGAWYLIDGYKTLKFQLTK